MRLFDKTGYCFCYVIMMQLCFLSCSDTSLKIQDAEIMEICRLNENMGQISAPTSVAVADDGRFAVCDNNCVYLYSSDGNQLRTIGNAGNARFEYNHPSVVNIHKDTIYVWSSFTMKFIAYTMDGTPVAQYRYESAISDFEVTDDCIVIYTAGLAVDNVLEVYDKHASMITERLVRSTDEHKLLLHLWSASPLFATGNKVYYSSRDNMTVYCYDVKTGENVIAEKIRSGTFKVDDIEDYEFVANNRKSRQAYLWENSQVLSIFRDNDSMYVMTLEGKDVFADDTFDSSGRYFVLHKSGDVKNDRTVAYCYDSIGSKRLLESTGHGLYILKHTIENGEDVYTLNKLIID